jgi:hypothetical protein
MCNTKVTVLDRQPISGSIKEVWFDANGECTWVEFAVDDDRWVGVFGRGQGSLTSACVFDSGNAAMVISRGQGYLVDIKSRALLHKTECKWLDSAMEVQDTSNVVACEYLDVHMYSKSGKIWSKCINENVTLISANAQLVSGEVDDWDGKYSFELDPSSGHVLRYTPTH